MSTSTQEPHSTVVIVGPGAMGCLFAGLLWESGIPVWLLDKDPGRVAWIQKHGVRLEGIGGSRTLPIPITHQTEEIGRAAIVLIWVKCYDTPSAASHAAPLIDRDTYLISLQNGLGNLEALAASANTRRILGGTTAQGATLLGPGHVRHAGAGLTQMGWYRPTDEVRPQTQCDNQIPWLLESFGQANIPTQWVDNVQSTLWQKLVVNAAINPLTAITRLRNGQLLEHHGTARLLHAVVDESLKVARAENICLKDDMKQRVEHVCKVTASNVSSMLQDVQKGKRTEIDAINGAIVGKAARWQISTPINQTLIDLVKTIEVPVSGAIHHEPTAQSG